MSFPKRDGTPVTGLTAVAAGAGDAQGLVADGGNRLMGYSIRETAGAAAVVSLRHGTADTDPPIAHESLAANGAITRFFGPDGITVPAGVFVERVSGSTELTLYTK